MQNLKYNAFGGIDLEYEHPVYGLIPTSTHPNDPPTVTLYAEAVALGTATPYVKPPITVSEMASAVQSHLDSTVKVKGYDSILSCASYVSSTNVTFASESAKVIVWRDAVWSYCYSELSKVQSGLRAIPDTTDAFILELPTLVW